MTKDRIQKAIGYLRAVQLDSLNTKEYEDAKQLIKDTNKDILLTEFEFMIIDSLYQIKELRKLNFRLQEQNKDLRLKLINK